MTEIAGYIGNPKQVPDAVGYLRYIQKGCLKLLTEFDRVCRQHRLRYAIAFGTLLGAVRTGRFIPWDDDLDVIMPRPDYQKIIKIFNESCMLPNVGARLHSDNNGIWNLIKIVHHKIPSIFVDIFPVDDVYCNLDLDGMRAYVDQMHKILVEHVKSQAQWPSLEAYHHSIDKVRQSKMPYMTPIAGTSSRAPCVVLGIDFYHRLVDMHCYPSDIVYPFKPIKFEGQTFMGVADPDMFSTFCYGDYMRLPSKFHMHQDLGKLKLEEVILLKRFIQTKKKS